MEGYAVGDISSFLNATPAPTPASTNDLFASAAPVASLEEVYAKPLAQGKRRKKDKSVKKFPKESDEDEETEIKFKPLTAEEQLAVNKRTLFVGNLPITFKKKHLHKMFSEFGKIESLRFRSVAVSDLKLGRKVCMKANKVNENATNKNAYIVFAAEECVGEALVKNGSKVDEHSIRVDKLTKTKREEVDDQKNSIFIGNMPFAATEEEVREALIQCGEIEYVRLLRDRETNIGKGIGYVKFVDSAGVLLAMKVKDSVSVGGRQLRIQRCRNKVALENKKKAADEKKKVAGEKKKKEGEKKQGFRGRKSKGGDKDLFKTGPTKKKNGFKNPGKGSNKQKPMTKKKFDKKVNKVSKKNQTKK